MTTPHRDLPRAPDHDAVAELLPWYVNATLGRDEAARVEAHLPACAACREDLARCRALALGTRAASSAEGWAPSPRHFARVLARVDAAERSRPGARGRALLERVRAWVRETPRPVRWAFAAQGVAALALAAALLARAPRAPASYETLSRPATAASARGDRALLHLVFAEEATERELRDVLRGVGGVVVGGPSARAVYTVELPVAAGERERVEGIAARLGREPSVRFVAVVPAASP
jgi:putative zinc finger protein